MLRVVHGIQIPWYGEATVVVIVPDTVTIIPVVEVSPHLTVGVEIEAEHHVLASLVNGKDVVACDHIASDAVDVGELVKLVRPLLQAVLLSAPDSETVKRDVAICLREVVAALLSKHEELVEVVWNLLARLIQRHKVIVVWVSRLEV